MAKQKFETAMKRLEDIVRELEAGELSLEDSLKKFEEARILLLSHRDIYPDNTFNDEILFYLAKSEEMLGNINAAISRYKELLVKFPNSLYSFDARENARKLTEKVTAEHI